MEIKITERKKEEVICTLLYNKKEVIGEYIAMFEKDWLKDPWLRLFGLVDHCNHIVKEGDWYQEDKNLFYRIKDDLMEKVYRDPPSGAEVKLKLVPYLKRCEICKDRAGKQMRNDVAPKGFEYYLEQIPPCPRDFEISEKATIEMEITYFGRVFCFHVPADKIHDWCLDRDSIERKVFVSGKEFHHRIFRPIYEEIKVLLDLI